MDVETLTWCFKGVAGLYVPWLKMTLASMSSILLVYFIHYTKLKCYYWIPIQACILYSIYYFGCDYTLHHDLGVASGMIV